MIRRIQGWLLIGAMIVLCSCQYTVVYRFYNASDAAIAMEGTEMHETIQNGAFSNVYDYRTVGNALTIATEGSSQRYDMVMPDFVYMHSTRRPTAQKSLMLAIMVFGNDRKIQLGDLDEDGHVSIVPRQSPGYPLLPLDPVPSVKK